MTSTVLIADDHPATRAGVRRTLERESDFVVCAEVATAEAAITAAAAQRPDICLLDIRMPGDGIRAASAIHAQLADTRIVMLTVSRDDDDLFNALRAGASGYLLKDIPRDRLADALRRVLAGEAQLPGSLVARLIDEFRSRETHQRRIRAAGRTAELSSREWQVLNLLTRRMSTREIASELHVAEVTVRSHVANILRKLQVPDRNTAISLIASER